MSHKAFRPKKYAGFDILYNEYIVKIRRTLYIMALNSNEIGKIDKLITDAKSLKKQISTKVSDFTSFSGRITGYSSTKAHLKDCINTLNSISRSIEDFIRNYQDMKEANTKYSDKYFHSKANCEAAQRGSAGVAVSKGISDLRELSDQFNNTLIKGMTLKASIEDSMQDQEANRYGRMQGKNNPNASCKDLVNKYRPNGLNQKY